MATLARPLAVITGASKGIGFQLARQAAQHGYDLVIAAGSIQIEEAAEELRAIGVNAETVQADLATREGCQQLIDAVDRLARPVEILALNAGVGVGGDFARETLLDEELNLVNLNCVSTIRLAKWGARQMVDRGRGRILITSSIAGIMPTPLEAVYGASKAFDLAFAAALHYELQGTGVTVTAMLPGPTDTDFFSRAGLDDTKVAEQAVNNKPEDVARMGFDALLAGQERIVAGNFGVKAQGLLARFIPEAAKAAMHKKMAEPGSAKNEKSR